jgi:hypothetical protein
MTYVNTLSNDEQTLIKKCLAFTIAMPSSTREYLKDPCAVIPFPVERRLAVKED